jgi:thiamine pyrophosphate-dependent acetolactate synthase large subunit-like protein
MGESRPDIDRQSSAPSDFAQWGSDHIAEVMRALDFEYVALTPGMTRYNHPLDYLGGDGGGGIGAGPGLAVGAALALRGTGRLPLAVLGDGDFIMGVSALWTATHARIPLLIVIANNRSFFNDEMHQERMARLRGRPVENRWIGQRIDEPGIDHAALARAQGAIALGPVKNPGDLEPVLRDAVAKTRSGAVVVVEALVVAEYDETIARTMVRGSQ